MSIRSILTLLQFSISTLMLIMTLVVTHQIQYMVGHDNGLSLNQVLIVKPPTIRSDNYRRQLDLFKNRIQTRSFTASVSTASATPGLGYNYSTHVRLLNSSADPILVFVDGIDENFIDHYHLELLSGRSFDQSFRNEREKVVINKTASLTLGFEKPSDAISERIITERDTLEIIGVLSDYNHRSLTESYDAQVFGFYGNYTPHFSIKIQSSSKIEMMENLSQIEDDFKEIFAENSVDYFFLDDKFNEQYRKDVLANQVSWYFTLISLTITVIGLIGFISYTLSKRLKEVAIRRVLGSMKRSILFKLGEPIIKILIAAGIIATVGGYFLVNIWLNQYAFRIDLSTFHFIVPVALTGFISAVILILRSMKAVSRNPVRYLRND